MYGYMSRRMEAAIEWECLSEMELVKESWYANSRMPGNRKNVLSCFGIWVVLCLVSSAIPQVEAEVAQPAATSFRVARGRCVHTPDRTSS